MRHILGPQFQQVVTSKGKKKTVKVTRHPSKRVADAVFDQMTEDYPKDVLDWVHKIKWRGPIEYPVDNIDFDDKFSWRAVKEPGTIRKWKNRIEDAESHSEHVKPAVLIERPKDTAMITDGHHRTIAYQKLGKPVYAWVGYPARAKGPWDTVHDYQFRDESGPQKGGNPGDFHYGKK